MSNQLKNLLDKIEPIENIEYLNNIVKKRDDLKITLLQYETKVLNITNDKNEKNLQEYKKLNEEIIKFVNEAVKIYADKCFNAFIQYTNNM